ncbi:hypothetical protein Tco_1432675 [Tanacetum coccineum]
MVQDQEEVGEGSKMPIDPHYTPTIIQPSISEPEKKQISRRSKRKDTEVPQPSGPTTNVEGEAVNEEMDDSLQRAATTATGLKAKQDNGNIDKTQSKATLNEPSSPGTSSATKIASMKNRVKKLERRNKSRTHGLKRLNRVGSSRRVESFEDEGLGKEDASKQGRIDDIEANEYIYLVNVQIDKDVFGVNDLDGDEVIVEKNALYKVTNIHKKTKIKAKTGQNQARDWKERGKPKLKAYAS